MHYENLIDVITNGLASLNKSETKVAQAILLDPEAATRSSIASLAKKADVSEPSVNRFCKRFKTAGFPDFKIQLAKSLVSGVRFVNRNVDEGDQVDSYTPKIFDSTINDLARVRDNISHKIVNDVVDQLIAANRIYFFGLGTSGVLMMRMLASTGSPGDVFFVISHTGRTKEIVDIVQIAMKNDAMVVALTSPRSPLAMLSSISLEVDVPENTDEYMAMTSRIVHLVILDVLATGFTLRRGPEFLTHLEKIKSSLKPTRYNQFGK